MNSNEDDVNITHWSLHLLRKPSGHSSAKISVKKIVLFQYVSSSYKRERWAKLGYQHPYAGAAGVYEV
jgi:hypothetical protein